MCMSVDQIRLELYTFYESTKFVASQFHGRFIQRIFSAMTSERAISAYKITAVAVGLWLLIDLSLNTATHQKKVEKELENLKTRLTTNQNSNSNLANSDVIQTLIAEIRKQN